MNPRKGWTGRRVTNARKHVRARGQVQVCWRCGRALNLDDERWQVGHITSLTNGGNMNDPTNWAAEHGHCNESAGGHIGGTRTQAQRRQTKTRKTGTWRW